MERDVGVADRVDGELNALRSIRGVLRNSRIGIGNVLVFGGKLAPAIGVSGARADSTSAADAQRFSAKLELTVLRT